MQGWWGGELRLHLPPHTDEWCGGDRILQQIKKKQAQPWLHFRHKKKKVGFHWRDITYQKGFLVGSKGKGKAMYPFKRAFQAPHVHKYILRRQQLCSSFPFLCQGRMTPSIGSCIYPWACSFLHTPPPSRRNNLGCLIPKHTKEANSRCKPPFASCLV